ncbi:MAG: hypothetical protein GX137_04055 [Thermoplasmatales archaeon]|nr:hypothetical protein [Thermoplasmatales archaeon]
MSRDSAEHICDVQGCTDKAERSISGKKVEMTDLALKSEGIRQDHLCKTHYREFKKETKGTIPDYMG